MKLQTKISELDVTFSYYTLYRYITNDLTPRGDILQRLYINKLFIYKR